MVKQKRVLLGVTGSIAAYKSAEIIRRLVEKGLKVSVIMTKEAGHFITPLTLASLSGEKVYQGMFDKKKDPEEMPHITLARDADVFIIAPATANIIGKLANGIADDLLTCIALATKAPILIAPAMNTQMYQNKIVQENCRKLKKYGVQFIDPIRGNLACGTTGKGHIADETIIVKTVLRTIK
ncbi:MAG: bifunctional phosphopantothenoylcysteine decarboxylase/phosphopantothenate--cysteine ligase CoaBC [Candidatus Omnitrophica bacterium]|nr:bifunctional phosphopantothenoylcysteine decarboxylase/phosphopantothenate--cysteine ligase CoaBC [Candidatus Omnitrophota bacterium]